MDYLVAEDPEVLHEIQELNDREKSCSLCGDVPHRGLNDGDICFSCLRETDSRYPDIEEPLDDQPF